MTQTAVSWLENELSKYDIHKPISLSNWDTLKQLLEKAKQIEKENIAKAWDSGKHQYFSLGIPEIEFNDGKEYYDINYNETYNK
jgi:hypothetical protein